jgi:flagellar hook-length control protein FliK
VIQLLGVPVNGNSQTGKIAANVKEQAAGFEAILQLIGQIEEENTESLGLVNQLPFLQQNPLMVPLLKQPTVQEPTASEEQGEVIFAKQQNAPVLESVVKESVTSVVKIGPNAAALSAGAAAEGVNGEAKAVMVRVVNGAATEEEMLKGFIQNSEDSGRNETPNAVQTSKNAPADFFTMVNSTPANQPIIASEKAVPAQIVHANQFDQEVTKFLQSSINVTGFENRMEAAFTLAPKHLGKVDVKVTIQDGQVTAEFLTSTPLGKDLLETHVQALRSALETQGLQVGKIDVAQQSTTASNFLGHFSQKGDSQTRQGQPDSRKRGEQPLLQNQDEYRDYVTETGWVSKINTTA